MLLWPDTFNNHLTPHTAQAAVHVLEDAGFRVTVPRRQICCGRPLYDFGFLEQAKSYLRSILELLQEEIAAGTPIVCLEPSCASVFKDELCNLITDDPAARRLQSQVILFADFLDQVGYKPAQLPPGTRALLHGHCHHKALWSLTPEVRLLTAAGLETETLDSGCCGLAGSFGYEASHHEISMAIGNRVLLPRVREAAPRTLIVSDGFSCRQQIAQGSARQALHTAEVLEMALGNVSLAAKGGGPIEAGYTQPRPRYPWLAAVAVVVLGVLAVRGIRRA